MLKDLRARLKARRAELKGMRIVVLSGGGSAEREVSLRSGASMRAVLADAGYDPKLLTLDHSYLRLDEHPTPGLGASDMTNGSSGLLRTETSGLSLLGGAEMVLSALHGGAGENGAWQGLLELAGVPYVSAGIKGSALAMDKALTKRILESLGIPTPHWWLLHRGENSPQVPGSITELVAKPVAEGSSVGILMVGNDTGGWQRITELNKRYDPLLLERRVRGRELTCSVIGPSGQPLALPLVEIRAGGEFYDYRAKYTAGGSEYHCPADVDESVAAVIREHAQAAYREMDLGPFARLDCILDETGTPWFLEANTLPGFTELSLLPMAARAAGIEMDELLELLMLLGLERHESRAVTAAIDDPAEAACR